MSDATPLRVLVVDDERPARQRLEDLLAAEPHTEVVASCASGRAAVEAIRAHDPDLVLLDIQMPGLSGLDVIREIGPERMPVVIFVTAYDQHALHAFDVAALDYLLKPFEDERFAAALDRARRQIRLEAVDRMRDRITTLLKSTGAAAARETEPVPPESDGAAASTDGETLQRIPVRKAKEIQVVSVERVAFFQADGPYVELHMDDRSTHLIRERMKNLEAQLDPHHFCRIHRSTIINLNFVESVQPNYEDRYVVQLATGDRLDVSRRRRDAFEDRFGLSF